MGSINKSKPLSTFLKVLPLINLSNIDKKISEIILGMVEIEPGAARSGSKNANHCTILRSRPQPYFTKGFNVTMVFMTKIFLSPKKTCKRENWEVTLS